MRSRLRTFAVAFAGSAPLEPSPQSDEFVRTIRSAQLIWKPLSNSSLQAKSNKPSLMMKWVTRYTGTDFAQWDESAQNSYIQTSVTMAGVVLTQIAPEKSACIDGWYLGGGKKAERDSLIRKTIAQYGSYHPSGTILAVLQEACGPLN